MLTPVSAEVVVNGGAERDAWISKMRELVRTSVSAQWELGDRWRTRPKEYGSGKELAAEIGVDYQTLRNLGSLCEKFELYRRRYSLTPAHHAEVKTLDPAAADRLLDRAESEQLPVKELRNLVRAARTPTSDTPSLPVGAYDVILADPPWRYEGSETQVREIENHYPTMDLEAICALEPPAADDAILFLWGTAPKLPEALAVIEAWGFTYRTCMVWVKDKIGMGYYARGRHELLLIAKRGNAGPPPPEARPDSVITAPRGRHSAKPDEACELIERMYPAATRLEMFCRHPRAGWTAWGNEVQVSA